MKKKKKKWMIKFIYYQKKQLSFVESPIEHFLIGLNKIKSVVLDLKPESKDLINKTCLTLLVSMMLLQNQDQNQTLKRSIVTVGSLQGTKLMTLIDKLSSLNVCTLSIQLLKIVVQGLIGNERGLKPFWNKQCLEMSKKLWLPIETDCAASRMSLSNLYLQKTMSNSLFSTKLRMNQEQTNLQTISYPLSKFMHVEEMEKEDTKPVLRARKVKIYPTRTQMKKLKQWFGVSRLVYNRALNDIKENKEEINFFKLRNKHVTKKNNPIPNEFEFEVPKDVRAECVRDLVKNFNTAFSNLKKNNITKFKMGYKSKKNDRSCIVVSKSAIKVPKIKVNKRRAKMKLKVFPKFLGKNGIKLCNDKKTQKALRNLNKFKNDCRLLYDRSEYFLIIPLEKKLKRPSLNQFSCALDPGVRKFQTIYSPTNTLSIEMKKELKRKLFLKLDKLRSLKAKNLISESKFKSKYYKIQKRIEHLVDEMHYKLINYLLNNFKVIHIPKFETKPISQKLKFNKSTNRDLFNQRQYTFRTRLIHSAGDGFKINVCNEAFTSKTCTWCGTMNDKLGRSKTFNCDVCKLSINRDINGARNIFLKYES